MLFYIRSHWLSFLAITTELSRNIPDDVLSRTSPGRTASASTSSRSDARNSSPARTLSFCVQATLTRTRIATKQRKRYKDLSHVFGFTS